ncbi:ankyrin repeat domain-containing protein [Rhodopirellula bahusiensis]|uniref:ankyrin repeat domain-containing protein n=1 Tax=Rhodopirellula bahusiensis TaxID=2014065 RepID=UPI0032662E7E
MRNLVLVCIVVFATESAVADDLSPGQQLVDACYRLNQFRVVKLLRDGVDVDTTFGESRRVGAYPKEWTPLLALVHSPNGRDHSDPQSDAVRYKRAAILRVLISNKCDLDATDRTGATALHTAIRNREVELANLILLYRPNVNTWATREFWKRESPLHSAYWSPELSALLVSQGATAKVSDEYRLVAAKADYCEALMEFLKLHHREPTDEEKTALGFDPRFGQVETPRERNSRAMAEVLEAKETQLLDDDESF